MSNQWTRVDQSEGPTLELPPHASMRAIKAALGITGRRTVETGAYGQWRAYRLRGTVYTFTVTECF